MSIERLSGGLAPADGSDPRTFPEIWNQTAGEIEQAQADISTNQLNISDLLDKNLPDFGDEVPEDGEVLTFDEASGKWVPGRGSGASLTVDSVAPAEPEQGDLWYNSSLGRTFVYYDDGDSAQWVEVGSGSGPTAAAVESLAPVSAEQGQLWFDSSTGQLYFYYVDADSAQWVQVRSAAPSTPATGFTYVTQIRYTSNGQFNKADYPWLRAIRVRCQGGGGGGGGAQGANRGSQGGGGGGYAESFITDIAGLPSSVTVTRGGGGSGGSGGANGSAGSSSSFDALVVASGGDGGSQAGGLQNLGVGGVGTAGDLLVSGSGGQAGANSIAPVGEVATLAP